MRQDRLSEAETAYNQALPLYRQIEDRLGEANTRKSLGQLRSKQDRVEEAEAHFAQALQMYEAIGERYSIAITLTYRGQHRLHHQFPAGLADWGISLPLSLTIDVFLFRAIMGITWSELQQYLHQSDYSLLAEGVGLFISAYNQTIANLALNDEQQEILSLIAAAFQVVGAISATHVAQDAEEQAQMTAFAHSTAAAVDQASGSMFGLSELVKTHLPPGI